MSQIVQHYTDVAMTLKEYPITVPAAIPISETKDLDDFINETPSEAPQDGKIYGRKNGAWVEAADENLATDVSTLVRNLSYYVCESEPEDIIRIAGDQEVLPHVEGYSHKVLMRNSYTGYERGIKYSFFGVSKLIIYNGAPVTSANTWVDGEIVEMSLIDNRWIATPLYVHAQGNLTVVDLGVILDTNKTSWPNQHPYLLSHRHILSSHFRELSLPEIGGVRVDCFGHGLTMDEDLNELVKVGNYYSIVSHDVDDINSDKLEGFWSYDSLVLFGPDFDTIVPTILDKDAEWWSETIKTAFDEDIQKVIHRVQQTLDNEIEKIGNIDDLYTDSKDTLVNAINELYAHTGTDKGAVYGIRHMYNNSSSSCIRIGNDDLHATLPVQHLIRRCILKDDGTVAYYLNAYDSTKKLNGDEANLDGTDGQVMVEIPQHYRRFTDHKELGAYDCEISLYPFEGAHKINRCYISAYLATIHRPDNKLSSVTSMNPEYRGGNNNASYDGTYRTMLGRPASGNISLTSARISAHNRGQGWEQMIYDAYVAIYWLYVVEYADLNSQLAFNPNRTDVGYHQGGLGDGVTTVNDIQWNEKFTYYPFVPCGITNELGNQTGVVLYDVPDSNENSIWCEVSVPSYRGIENPFGHIWHWCDGFLAVGDGEKLEYFICHDRKKFASDKNDGYKSVGMSCGANGYVKTILRTELGDILAASIGGGSTTWFANYHYEAFVNGTTYGLLLGGDANDGANAGLAYGSSNDGPSASYAAVGSRLCYVNTNNIIDTEF